MMRLCFVALLVAHVAVSQYVGVRPASNLEARIEENENWIQIEQVDTGPREVILDKTNIAADAWKWPGYALPFSTSYRVQGVVAEQENPTLNYEFTSPDYQAGRGEDVPAVFWNPKSPYIGGVVAVKLNERFQAQPASRLKKGTQFRYKLE